MTLQGAPPKIERLPQREDPQRLPEPVEGDEGRWVIDARWGVVQPMSLAPGVETLGELEVVEHIGSGGSVIDSRLRKYLGSGVLPTALNIPHDEVLRHRAAFPEGSRTLLYCNGPMCEASPDAIKELLDAGQPPHSLLYYRGGILDWVACGYPLVEPPG